MKEKYFFIGLPASAGTIILLVLVFLQVELLYIMPVILIVSFALVSNICFPKPRLIVDVLAAVLLRS